MLNILHMASKVLIILSISALCAGKSDDHNNQARYVNVSTKSGKLRGEVVKYSIEYPEGNNSLATVTQFLGVPYARPPVGKLRWKNPKMVKHWEGLRDATAYGNTCWQNSPVLPTPMSEDCLFLNIWIPGILTSRQKTKELTVMFWIHPGGFQRGSGSLEIYNGAYLANDQNVIVVTINYRLNSFGFLSSESKPDEGNWGLKDCVLALKWVHKYMRSFGGNPKSVTIFGESAGAGAVTLLMVSRQTKGLFKRAIVQSGSPFVFLAMNPRGTNQRIQESLASKLGCSLNNSMKCLTKKSAVDINNETSKLSGPFDPNVDGTFFHDEPENILKNGDFEAVECINGVTSHEGTVTFAMDTTPEEGDIGTGYTFSQFNNTVSSFLKFLDHQDNRNIVQHGIQLIYDDYSVNGDVKSIERTKGLFDFLGDFVITAGSHKFGTLYQKQSTKKMFCYYMDVKISKDFQLFPSIYKRPDWLHTGHGDDIQFVLGAVKYTHKTVTHEERELSGEMMTAWANFAKTGNPTGLGSIDWPEFTGSNYLQLSTPVSSSTIIERFFPKRMDFWINYIWQKLDVPSVKCAPNSQSSEDSNRCPVCLNKVPNDITDIVCKAKHAFKVSILSENVLMIEVDLRSVTVNLRLDRYATYDLGSGCDCGVITDAAPSDKLLILTMATDDNMSSLFTDNKATVIKLDNKLVRRIIKAIKNDKCPK